MCIYMNYLIVRKGIKGGFWIHTRVYLHEFQDDAYENKGEILDKDTCVFT